VTKAEDFPALHVLSALPPLDTLSTNKKRIMVILINKAVREADEKKDSRA
jgi:hypothetical protein